MGCRLIFRDHCRDRGGESLSGKYVIREHREHDDRGMGKYLFQHESSFKSIHDWHRVIEHDEVRLESLGVGYGLLTIFRL